MKARPLCTICLLFLIINGIQLMVTGGEIEIPASSIFYEYESDIESFAQGQVYQKKETPNNQVLYLKNISIKHRKQSFYESRIIIYDSEFTDIPIGASVCLRGRLSVFEESRNPGNFDQRAYYGRQEIYGFMNCKQVISVTGRDEIRDGLYQWKQKWKRVLKENMSEENGAVLCAMLLGEKSEMNEEVKELYQKNGISHILAISGLHISFIGLGIYHFLRKAGMPYSISGVIAIVILGAYTRGSPCAR